MSSETNDNLPILPETRATEPLVQCGVLYLGSGPTSPGLRALDSIQEPFSHRYPVDGTNTVRGIDAVLSVYENGIQMAFTRQPHAVVFFPIASLVYCASIRFSMVANDLTSLVDWRFIPLDQLQDPQNNSKHPPLFSVVFHRTHIIPGDECHCFITKSAEASLALVQNITQIYTDLPRGIMTCRSPIFYQLDRFGRKLSEINGVIYLTPANDDQLPRRSKRSHASKSSSIQDYLSDPSLDGFFYRTNASLIEPWQLWDDDDQYGSRPRPPASPFGLHEGLYHDDMTEDIQRYLRRMEEEDESCSTCPDSKSKSSSESISSYSSSEPDSRKEDSSDNTDQFDQSLTKLQVSSFEPEIPKNRNQRVQMAPIIIEKKIPALPVHKPIFPKTPRSKRKERRLEALETNIDYVPSADTFSISYQINERGEKITKDGNRLLYMDVVRPTMNHSHPESPVYQSKKSIRRRSAHIPVLDMQSIEALFAEKKNRRRRQSIHLDEPRQYQQTPSEKRSLTTTDLFRTIDQHSALTSVSNRTRSSHNPSPARSHQPSISSRSHRSEKSVHSLIEKKTYPTPPVLTNEQLNQYVSNIYGTAGSVRSSSRSTNRRPVSSSVRSSIKSVNHVSSPFAPTVNAAPASDTIIHPAHMAHFRYIRSSVNPSMMGEYHQNAY